MNFSPLSMTLRTLHPDQTTSATKCLKIYPWNLWKSCYSCLTKSGSPAKFLHPGYIPLLSLFQNITNLCTYRLPTTQYPWPAMFVSFSKKWLCVASTGFKSITMSFVSRSPTSDSAAKQRIIFSVSMTQSTNPSQTQRFVCLYWHRKGLRHGEQSGSSIQAA